MTICRYFFENMRDGFKADALVWQRHNNIINFENCQTYSLKMASFSFKCKLFNSINVKFSENNAMDASRLNLNLLKIDALVHSICRLTPAMWSQIKRIAIQACKKVFFIYTKMDIPQHFHSQLFLTFFEVIYSVKYFLVCTWIYTAKLVHTLFKNIFYIL